MSKKDLLLNENKETKTKEVGEIPEVPKIILENDEVTVVFPTREEAMVTAIEYQRQNPNIREVEIVECFSMKFGSFFKIKAIDNPRTLQTIPTDIMIKLIKKQKMIAQLTK